MTNNEKELLELKQLLEENNVDISDMDLYITSTQINDNLVDFN